MTAALLCVAGLVALILGAEFLTRGGTRLAAALRIPPLVIGLTVVSVGTSAPELAVGIEAVATGAGSLAVGNIAGTNTFNILFILGLAALMQPLALDPRTVRIDLPAMNLAALALMAAAWDGVLTRVEGLLFVLGAPSIPRSSPPTPSRDAASRPAALPAAQSAAATLVNLALLVGGIVIIVLGADWLVGAPWSWPRCWASPRR